MWEHLYEIDGTNYEINEFGLVRTNISETQETYDASYFDKWKDIPQEKLDAISCVRLELLQKVVLRGCCLDFGCGLGDFIDYCHRVQKDITMYGYDLWRNPRNKGSAWTFITMEPVIINSWPAVCAFDALEHLENPNKTVLQMKTDTWVVSVPNADPSMFKNKELFKNWRHRRPTEHLYHFNTLSLVAFFDKLGFDTIYTGYPEDVVRKNDEQKFSNILSGVFSRRKKA